MLSHGIKANGGGGTGGFIGGGRGAELLAELGQFLRCHAPVGRLQTQSMLFAHVFDDSKITASIRAIQAFAHFGQDEATGF